MFPSICRDQVGAGHHHQCRPNVVQVFPIDMSRRNRRLQEVGAFQYLNEQRELRGKDACFVGGYLEDRSAQAVVEAP